MGCVCSKVKEESPESSQEPRWEWQEQCDILNCIEYQSILDHRRDQLLQKIYESEADEGYEDELVNEWMDLTTERDFNWRKTFTLESKAWILSRLIQLQNDLELLLSDNTCRAFVAEERYRLFYLCLEEAKREIHRFDAVEDNWLMKLAVMDHYFKKSITPLSSPEKNTSATNNPYSNSTSPPSFSEPKYFPAKKIRSQSFSEPSTTLPTQEDREAADAFLIAELELDSRTGLEEDNTNGFRTPASTVPSMETARSSVFSPFQVYRRNKQRYLGGASEAYEQWMGGMGRPDKDHLRGSRENLLDDISSVASDSSVD